MQELPQRNTASAIYREMGVRELKSRVSEVLREVEDRSLEVVVTVRGEPKAVLRSITPEDEERWRRDRRRQALAELDALAEEITAAWTSPKSAVELVEEQRR